MSESWFWSPGLRSRCWGSARPHPWSRGPWLFPALLLNEALGVGSPWPMLLGKMTWLIQNHWTYWRRMKKKGNKSHQWKSCFSWGWMQGLIFQSVFITSSVLPLQPLCAPCLMPDVRLGSAPFCCRRIWFERVLPELFVAKRKQFSSPLENTGGVWLNKSSSLGSGQKLS